MKKIYTRFFFVGVCGITLCALACWLSSHVALVHRLVSVGAYPLIVSQQFVVKRVEHALNMVRMNTDAQRICHTYQQRYENLLSDYIALSSIAATKHDIHELVSFEKRYRNGKVLIVQILARHFLPQKHFFIVDAGTNKGVKLDMIAVYKNCLVGRVTQVFPYYSYVTLITDRQCKIAATCVKTLDCGIHEGSCSRDTARLTYVPDSHLDLEKRLKKGDLVVSSGGLVFPRGFGLGTIFSCQRRDLQCEVLVKPLTDLSSLNYCCLLTPGSEYAGDEFVALPNKQEQQPVTDATKLAPAPSSLPAASGSPQSMAPTQAQQPS